MPKSDPQLGPEAEAVTELRHLVDSNPAPRVLESKAFVVLIFLFWGNLTTVAAHRSGVRLRPASPALSINQVGDSKQ